MIQICRKDKEKAYEAIRTGKIDAAEMSFPNLIDDILLTMKRRGITDALAQTLPDKRRDNSHIPFDILLCLAVAAKLKCKTSLTDVPFAVTEAELLAELGWNIWDNERNVSDGLFSESVMRKLLAKYKSEEWVSFYNAYVQGHLMRELDVQPCVHILDCTRVLVNLDNDNYENSSVAKIDGQAMRGYKLGVLRGILDDSGMAEEIVFGTLKTHDMEQCREMLRDTPCLHENDILINDRGFLSREMTNYLKTERRVDTYIPARENMTVYQDAVRLATASGRWQRHPNRKRKEQEIKLVTDLGPLWESDEPEKIYSSYYERYMLSQKPLTPAIEESRRATGNVFLDNYALDFLDVPETVSERDLQKSIIRNLKDFILESGKDFTFIGEEYRVQVGKHDYYIDLLFYHRELSCLVAFELKIGEFKPEYAGKINLYLEALDREVKKENENPSVGVILCARKEDKVVEFALSRSLSPTMVSEYNLKLIDKKLLQKKLKEYVELAGTVPGEE